MKLKDLESDWQRLEESANPFSIIVMAHLKALATLHDPSSRLNWKLRLVKMLYVRGFSRQDVLELFRFRVEPVVAHRPPHRPGREGFPHLMCYST